MRTFTSRRLAQRLRRYQRHAFDGLMARVQPMLRLSLGVVFVWFGVLKIFRASPVADLVAGTLPALDPDFTVPALGCIEVVLGMALLLGRRLVLAAACIAVHLTGTFLVLVVRPQVAFEHGNPLLLTTIGEFVVKNLVLIAAALAIIGTRRTNQHAAGPTAI